MTSLPTDTSMSHAEIDALTVEEQKQEVKRILGDRYNRLNTLYKIINKKGKKTTFNMNDTQEEFYHDMHFLNIILKARQLGFTTFIQLYMLDTCLFNANTHCGVIAQSLKLAQKIFEEKIKFPYENIPAALRNGVYATKNSTTEIQFSNGSSIYVDTSMRGGTLQMLHISEYGKICAKFPEKAREIRTGALNTIEQGQVIFIESTAEGQEGDFYELTQRAQEKQRNNTKLTSMDFKFFFYPWHQNKEYQTSAEGMELTKEDKDYFYKLEQGEEAFQEEPIILTDEQKAWYIKKEEVQREDMKREFPSTPREAFEQSIEGAYYARELALAEKQNRITCVPYDERYPVYTYWDIGMRDTTPIIYIQHLPTRHNIINYDEFSGGGLPMAIKLMNEKDYVYGDHNAPFDIKVSEWGTAKTRIEQALELGLEFTQVPSIPRMDGINAGRAIFGTCWIDKENCSRLIKSLRSYRKEWDDKLGKFKDTPLHNWASNGADAWRYFGVSYQDLFEAVNQDSHTQFEPVAVGRKQYRDYPEGPEDVVYESTEGYSLT